MHIFNCLFYPFFLLSSLLCYVPMFISVWFIYVLHFYPHFVTVIYVLVPYACQHVLWFFYHYRSLRWMFILARIIHARFGDVWSMQAVWLMSWVCWLAVCYCTWIYAQNNIFVPRNKPRISVTDIIPEVPVAVCSANLTVTLNYFAWAEWDF
jgi:hypothetical protein